ncbi:hypothetical protein CPB86DRAFT_588718 [Serendipita vermifera]|nr:hypothetical protein CPB86DRAFT_588718 [Serendipita vermifera]
MKAFLVVRYVVFALLVVLCGLNVSFAALNLGFLKSGVVPSTRAIVSQLDFYYASLSSFNILFIFVIIVTEILRKGAFVSRIWFELAWVALSFLAHLGGAIAGTQMIPKALCGTGASAKLVCMASMILIVFVWITASLHLVYFCILLAYGITQSRSTSGVWSSAVVDHPVQPDDASQSNVSIDSRRTLTNLQPVLFKGASQKGSPDSDQDLEKLNLPVYNPRFHSNEPPTFGAYAGRGSLDTAERTRVRGMGVHSINGAPVYRTNGIPSSQGPHQFYANPSQPRPAPRSSSENPANATNQPRRIAPWHNDEESPSPAEIRHASRVTNPSASLYPSHVVNAGLTTRPVQTAVPAKVGAMAELLKAAGLRTSTSSLPYTHSPNGNSQQSQLSVSGATVSRTSSTNSRHMQTQSVSSFVQAAPSNVVESPTMRNSRRSLSDGNIIITANKRKGPRRRPPPLNLSGLSNIANAERRR